MLKRVLLGVMAIIGTVLIADVSYSATYSYYLPYFVGHTNHWTGVGLSNTSTTYSAMVDVYVYDTNGNIIANDTLSIAARGHDVFTIGDGQPNEGWIKIRSTEPLVGLCFVATTGTVNYMADIPFASELSTLLYIPHIGQGPSFDTCVLVCNPNSVATTVTLTFVDQQGNALQTISQSVAANGSWKYELKNMLDSSTSNYGSLEISAANDLSAFALYNNLKKGGYSYAGISAVPAPGASGEDSKSYNQIMTEYLWGAWNFVYTVINTYSTKYYLGYEAEEYDNMPGEYYLSGFNEYGNYVLAGYDSSMGQYMLLDPGQLFDKFFVFDFTYAYEISGCYYQWYGGNLGSCYDMYGSDFTTFYGEGTGETVKITQFSETDMLEEAMAAGRGGSPDQTVIDAYTNMKKILNKKKQMKMIQK